MKKLRNVLLGLLAAVTLNCSAGASTPTVNEFSQSRLPGVWSFTDEQVTLLAVLQGHAWVEAKRLLRMEGLGIPPPKVGYGLLMYRYGSYDVGARTVLVDIRLLWQPLASTVMIHEMIHYIQDRKDPLRGDMVDMETVCREEKEAHDLTYKWAVEMGIAPAETRVRKWEDAAISYNCTVDGHFIRLFDK